jgi:hypothetical protein
MKKILIMMALIAIASIFAHAESFIYSTTVSTLSVGPRAEALNVAGINLSTVRVKNIIIHQTGTTEQTVTIYKNFTSTTAATAVATFVVPGTVGIYYPLGEFAPNTSAGNYDIINMPYFAIRTSTDVVANACKVVVIYGK